jgi:hypothetical protein
MQEYRSFSSGPTGGTEPGFAVGEMAVVAGLPTTLKNANDVSPKPLPPGMKNCAGNDGPV